MACERTSAGVRLGIVSQRSHHRKTSRGSGAHWEQESGKELREIHSAIMESERPESRCYVHTIPYRPLVITFRDDSSGACWMFGNFDVHVTSSKIDRLSSRAMLCGITPCRSDLIGACCCACWPCYLRWRCLQRTCRTLRPMRWMSESLWTSCTLRSTTVPPHAQANAIAERYPVTVSARSGERLDGNWRHVGRAVQAFNSFSARF